MKISIDLDKLINNEEKDILKEILSCDTDKELEKEVSGICKAAVYEYLEMILGKQLPTRANEIKERRLFHLLKYHFIGRIPRESEVSSLFQLTGSRSKTLLRNVKTKFRFELKKAIKNTVKTMLKEIKYENEEYHAIILNKNILEEIKQTVESEAPRLNQIRKVSNSASLYKIPIDTLKVLCDYYGIDFETLKKEAKKDE